MPFKIYAGFESLLIGVRGIDRNNNASCTEKNEKYIPCWCPCKVVCVDNRFNKSAVTEEKMQSIDLLKQFLKTMLIGKK